MAKDSMMLYVGLGVAGLVIFLTDNPIKTAIMKLVPTGGAAGAADDTASTDTGKKHKRGHRRGRHSHANYVEDCGY
jgi:hypothetical protein